MLDSKLFFGFLVDDDFSRLLSSVNPHALQLFIDNNSDYLHEVVHEGTRYLGKRLEQMVDVSNLELLAANIESLLRKLVSDYPYERVPLRIVAVS